MVRIDSESSDPVDPLVGRSSLSLFPLSFNPPPPSSTVHDPNPNFDPHSHLKAMVLRSPDELLKQAKAILDDSLQPDKTSLMASDDKTEKVSSINNKKYQEKRPALGLKRAKFSAKPMASQPDVVPEPSIDIGKLKDPEEFFAAFERMENAKKELQRLKGVPLADLDQNLPSLSPRCRRPSLFGKAATYKHHSYSSTMIGDNCETVLSSQETFEKHTASPTHQDALLESDTVNNSQQVRVYDATPAKNSELNELDELLSCDYEGLDEAGVVDLLQDKLQIKLRDVGKPALPDLLDVQQKEPETSCDTLPKMTDAIARLNGLTKAAGSKLLSLSSQLRESSDHLQASPQLRKSPLASMSLLNRHISKLSPSKNPFATVEIDLSPVRIPSRETVHGKKSDQVDTRKDLSESQTSSVHGEDITAVSNPPPVPEEITTSQGSEAKEQLDGVSHVDQDDVSRDLHQPRGSRFDQDVVNENLHEHRASTALEEEITAVPSELSPSLVSNNIPSPSEPKERMDGATQSGQVGTRTDLYDLRSSPVHGEQSFPDFGEDPVVPAAREIDPASENKDQEAETDAARDSKQQEVNIEGSTTEKSSASGVEECRVDKALNTEDIDIEEPNQEAAQPSQRKSKERRKSKAASQGSSSEDTVKEGGEANPQSDVSVSERTGNRKRKAEEGPRLSKRADLNRRNSLYAAGTKWEAGCRRSTRIRLRPLEYWRGERLLYGRVHNSLVTVIGVKYASPSKDAGEPAVKVKSFVSDKYKELVDLAALH